MRPLRELVRRWRHWRNRERLEAELAEEMRFHLDQKKGGAGFGNVTRLRELAREVWVPRFLDETAADVRYAIRGLRKSPGFAAVAIGTLALGIGAGTAIFSLAEAVLARPLPYRDAGRLFLIFEGSQSQNNVRGDTSPGTFRALREDLRSAESLALFGTTEFNLTGDGEPERVKAGMASANLFATLGVQPELGRLFAAGDDELGKHETVILSHALWQRRYGGDPAIVGRRIALGESSYTVIGVLPERFAFFYDNAVLWVPFALSPERWARRGARYIFVAGRLRQDAPLGQLQPELTALADRYRREFPRENSTIKLQAVSLHERLAEGSRVSLRLLLGAVIGLLLIACCNVANLFLTRSIGREAELAVRAALGAGRLRILRQLLTESLLIACAAGLAGLAIAQGAFRLLQPLVPVGMGAYTKLSLDGRVIGIMLLLALFCTLASGLLPALRSTGALTTRAIGGRRQEAARGALVVAEIAMAFLLLTGAGLLFRTFSNLRGFDPGFRPEGVLSAQLGLAPRLFREPVARTRFYQSVIEKVEAIPGVQRAAFATAIPTTWKGGISSFTPEGQTFDPVLHTAMMRQSTEGYLEVMGLRLRAGRWFTAGDGANSAPVAVVNQTMARQIWKGESPIGKRFRRDAVGAPWITVTGVVDDVFEMGLNREAPRITYFPESQQPEATFTSPMTIVLRTGGSPARYVNALRQTIWQENPGLVISKLLTAEEILSEETSALRIHTAITAAFGGVALLLACLGIYGVLSYAVTQRRREFGVRMAMGASRGQVVRMIAGRGARLALGGVALGAAASLLLTRYLESILFQVSPNDPVTLAAAAGAFLATAFGACLAPSLRAMRIEPGQALRYY